MSAPSTNPLTDRASVMAAILVAIPVNDAFILANTREWNNHD
jgi:hypothetical protein